MSNKEYPEELYNLWCKETTYSEDMEAAYDVGFARGVKHAQANTGDWHNLTKAIADGEPIDFEKLDGRKVRMMNEDGRDLRGYKLVRDSPTKADSPEHWELDKTVDYSKYPSELDIAWRGSDGWILWLDGEIPMRKQTADELPFGTNFKDSHGHGYVVVAYGKVQALYGNYNVTMAKNIVVAEVLGMYGQKESE